ncbi:MAG: HAD-IA family hydrolase [Candidatus Aegiribacteria sp.]|nr:HAD-IA family hydrolase [Candidatus Aegiribacteria sp.]
MAGWSTSLRKPFPDIFLYSARELNTLPGNCLVLEDAEKGIRAAEAAGMKSIAVPKIYTVRNDFSKATIILPSLEDVTLELIEYL